MNEQEISNIVKTILEERKTASASHTEGHVCQCSQHKMTLDKANILIEKVKEKAASMGVNVVIAVADQAGRPVAVQCMDGAYIASFDIALNKSFTSASLKMSTETLSGLSQPGQSLYGIQFTNGRIIGALGVSGGSAEEDTAIAAYGKKVFEEVVACL